MKRPIFIIILILIAMGITVWINSTERRAEKIFSSEGIGIRVLEGEAKGGLTKIVEPNGELSLFSDRVKVIGLRGRSCRGLRKNRRPSCARWIISTTG
jgi:hypothetical protein